VIAVPRAVRTLFACGLLSLLLQLLGAGCAESSGIGFDRPPDAGTGSTATGGQVGTGGLPATGGAGGAAGTSGISSTGGTGGGAGTRATGGNAGTGGTGGAGGSAATFTQIYQTILTVTCTRSQCHSPGKQAGVNFASQSSAYTSLKSRVEPGDAEASSFYALLNAGVMPPTGNNLTSAQLAEIASWIDAGATNN
jgi:predicted CxxxxCH...CXXCH cytochrome family protein